LTTKSIGSREQSRINHRINDNKIVERRCTQCSNWLEENTDNFYMQNKSKPEMGFTPRCRSCTRINANEHREENKEDYIKYSYEYRKTNREEDNEKHKKIARSRVRYKDYLSNYLKGWYKREENKGKQLTYGLNHRNHEISEAEWKACLKAFDYKCAYCGLPMEDHIIIRKGKSVFMNFHKEHVDDNGYNDLRNCVPSCRSCNSHKHMGSLDDWYKIQEFFTEDRYNKIIWWTTEGYKSYIQDRPPYRIAKKRNDIDGKFYWNLWSVDEKRNLVEIIVTKRKRSDLDDDVEKYMSKVQ